MVSEMDAYRDVFLAESADYLQSIIDGLIGLENCPEDSAHIEQIFRGAHSLKGMAAAMNYQHTADLAHRMESLMDRVRRQELSPAQAVIDVMLEAVDALRDLIHDESNGTAETDASGLMVRIEAYISAPADAEPVAGSSASMDLNAGGAALSAGAGETRWRVVVGLEDACVLKAVRAYMVIKRLSQMGRVVDTIPSAREIEDEQFDTEFVVVIESRATPSDIRAAALHVSEVKGCEVVHVSLQVADETRPDAVREPRAASTSRGRALPRLSETQTVRVAIGHLDALVDLVGELVILRSRLERIAEDRKDSELATTIDELQRISTELQYEVMQTRMVPVENIFNRFPRLVRDLAIDLGKRVEFRMDGLDIELDRTVLDEIGDPLVHLLRNSIDHGIESPEERAATAKPTVGRVSLTASRERDHVAITVADDGRGIDPDRIWRKAVDRHIVSADQRPEYSDDEVLMLTCLPGFSTAEKTTKVSGRGVGTDVVKGKIEYLGGTIRIKSCVGKGTEFILRLPLTLAIVQALLVVSRNQPYAIPLSAVDEVFSADDVSIDTVDGSTVLVLRQGEVVPFHRLDAILHGADPSIAPDPRSSVVLLRSGDEPHALHVDSMAGRREIVLKPLSGLFRETKGFSGATILGDGRVMLVLDPRNLFASMEPIG